MATKVTKDVIATGVSGVGSDYFGAIKGALSIAGDFAHPVCGTMNGIEFDDDDDWVDWGLQHDSRYLDNYFLL